MSEVPSPAAKREGAAEPEQPEVVVVESPGNVGAAIAAIGRGGAVVVAAPRFVAGLAADLGRIAVATAEMARYTRVLPEVAERLSQIADRVERLDGGVDQMARDVGVMRDDVTDLPRAIDALEARLERVEMAMSPLRRTRKRFRRGEGAADVDAAAESPGDAEAGGESAHAEPPLDPDAPEPPGADTPRD